MAKESILLSVLSVITNIGANREVYPDCVTVGRDVETIEDFPEIFTQSWQECSASCRSNPKCDYWVWRTDEWHLCRKNKGAKKACYRKVGSGKLVAAPCQTDGLLAGHRDCNNVTYSTTSSSMTTTTTTTSTTTTCRDIGVKILVKDGTNNTAIENATVSLNLVENEIVSPQVHTNLTDSNGRIIIPLSRSGEFVARVKSSGYIEDKTSLNVSCDIQNCHLCSPTILISLLPTPRDREVRLVMNWDKDPPILDLHVVQIDTSSSPPSSCHTYYDAKDGCVGVVQEVDNVDGGYEGAETFTFHREAQENRYIYMVFVDDYGQEDGLQAQLGGSNVRLSVVSATETLKETMEEVLEVEYNGQRFWIAGCLRFSEDEIEWKPQGLLTTVSPLQQSSNHCLSVFLAATSG